MAETTTKQNPNPKYRRQKRRGAPDRAFVELGGRRYWLGRYGSPASRQAYHRLLAEWTSGGGPPVKRQEITCVELAERFWRHADEYYRRPDGTPTMLDRVRQSLKPLVGLYGGQPVTAFGPNALRAVRDGWIKAGLARKTINDYTATLKHIFKWAVGHELAPASTYEALRCVEGLRRGRSKARETEAVKPVAQADIEAVQPYLARQVWGLIQLQLLTGARPGELVRLRPRDLDMTDDRIWTFRPIEHKGAYRRHRREIWLGPKAQEIIRPFLVGRALDACVFSPAEAEAERLAARHAARVTPPGYGNSPGTNRQRHPKRPPGASYTVGTYRQAIHRACKAAGIALWSPHRLRHNTATELRRKHGIELAQTILGHRLGSEITEIYAEANVARAKAILAKIG